MPGAVAFNHDVEEDRLSPDSCGKFCEGANTHTFPGSRLKNDRYICLPNLPDKTWGNRVYEIGVDGL